MRSTLQALGLLALFLTGCRREAELPAVQPGVDVSADTQPRLVALEELAKKYCIQVVTQPAFPIPYGKDLITGEIAEPSDVENYAALFIEEWSLYPVEMIRKTNLRRVILCKGLAFNGQLRTALPDYYHDDLLVDIIRGRENSVYTRQILHHEFFHVVDWKDDGQVYQDERWLKLNPRSFKYGYGGPAMQGDRNSSLLTEDLPGFLTRYSTSGLEEDKAEVFAWMVMKPSYVSERAKKDPVLKAKTVRIKELVQDFCPQMDDSFWERVQRRSTDLRSERR
jgi:hypothetical protein